MKNKALTIQALGALVISLILISGCQKTQTASKISPETFESTYTTVEGRSIGISGLNYAAPGEQSEYLLKINNNGESWQGEYFVLLLDDDEVIQELSHKQLDIPGNGGIQEPIMVEPPAGFEGTLGLWVLIPQGAELITRITVGEKNAVAQNKVTPIHTDIRSHPVSTN